MLFGTQFRDRALKAGVAGALAALMLTTALPATVYAQDAAPAAPAQTPAEAPAQPAQPDPEAVVATVGDETITEADLTFAAEDLGQDLANVPPADRRAFLLTVLIDMKVMAKGARDAGLDQTEIFARRLGYLEERALRRAYFAETVAAKVTPEAIAAAYDTFVADFQPQPEIRARHILVATEDEAKAIKAEIEGGRPFEELAAEKSTDGSAANGGDLGFFGQGMMVQPFSDVAFSLEPGQLSDPVQTQFGWHLIKVEEKRESTPPTMQQLMGQLQQQVLFTAFEDAVTELKADLPVNIPDPALAAAVSAQTQAAETAAPAAP